MAIFIFKSNLTIPNHKQPSTTSAGDNPSPAFFIPITIYKDWILLSINGKIPLYLHKIKGDLKS